MTNAEAGTAATVAAQGAHVAPEKGASQKGASRKKGAPKGAQTAKGGKAAGNKAQTAKKAAARTPRAESKGAKVQEMLRRAKGATLAEIMKTTGWQAHSVRGFISGTLTKKLGLKVESFRPEGGERSYRIK